MAGVWNGDEVFCQFSGECLIPSLPTAQKLLAARPFGRDLPCSRSTADGHLSSVLLSVQPARLLWL